MNQRIALTSVLILALFLAACGNSGQPQGAGAAFVGGREGIVATFMDGMPPGEVFDNNQYEFDVQIKMDNKGETEIPANDLSVQITGISPTAFGAATLQKTNQNKIGKTSKDVSGSVTPAPPEWISFDKLKYKDDLPGNLPFKVRADICYLYQTQAIAKICVNRDIVKNVGKESICTNTGEKQVQNSGAPIQITSVKQEAIGNGRTQLTFMVSHVGPGDAFFKYDTAGVEGNKCDLAVTNRDKFKVEVEVTPNFGGTTTCTGFDGGGNSNKGFITMYDMGPRSVTCTVTLPAGSSVYEDFVKFNLKYRYLQHIEKPLLVKDVGTAATS